MKTNIKLLITTALITINFTGCILPYKETFVCNKGLNTGNCQSVSKNYQDTFLDKNTIPFTHKQKTILVEELDEQEIISNSIFGNDEILDWYQISSFSRPKLKYILEIYDFDESTKEKLKEIIKDTVKNKNMSSNNLNFDAQELIKYMRLKNEILHEENLELKTQNKEIK